MVVHWGRSGRVGRVVRCSGSSLLVDCFGSWRREDVGVIYQVNVGSVTAVFEKGGGDVVDCLEGVERTGRVRSTMFKSRNS